MTHHSTRHTSKESLRSPKSAGWIAALLLGVAALAQPRAAHAELFTLPHYVAPGEFAVGIEPEITLTDGAGLGGDIHFQYGLNELVNVKARIGTGSNYRHFRYGVAGSLDFFPDVKGQPGIGIAASADYYNLYASGGQLELKAIPYIHKTLVVNTSGKSDQPGEEIEPFLAIPLGIGFNSGRYLGISEIVFGSFFKSSEHFRFSLEVGVAINNTTTYISGGVAYYY